MEQKMETKCKNEYSSQTICLDNFEVAVIVDVDGHLSLFIKSKDGSKLVDISDDIGKEGEVCLRVSTEAIEREYDQRDLKGLSENEITKESTSEIINFTGQSKIEILRRFGYDVWPFCHQFKAAIVENPEAFTIILNSEREAIDQAYQFLKDEVDPDIGYVFPS
jgi:hypothetical protein